MSQSPESEYGRAGPAVHLSGKGVGIGEMLFSHLRWVGELALTAGELALFLTC